MSSIQSKPALFVALFFTSMLSASLSWAAPEYSKPQGAPPEAIEACADLSQGDACSFTGRRDEQLSGTCNVLPAGHKVLACAPEGGSPHEGGRPK